METGFESWNWKLKRVDEKEGRIKTNERKMRFLFFFIGG